MEKVRPLCGQPSDRGRLKNRTDCFNVLIYVDIVILAFSWRGFRGLVLGLHVQTSLYLVYLAISTKTVCMSFMPKKEIVCMGPSRLGVSDLQFVPQFKYLGVGTHYNTQPV